MFTTLLIQPIYNLFIFILGLVPGGDVGIAIIILTVLIRVLFYPLFTSQIRSQMALQALQPELDELKEKHKGNTAELARLQAELFRKHNVRPFALIGSAIVQIVIFLALSSIFYKLKLPEIRTDLLYSFISSPPAISPEFLGFFNLTSARHLVLALLVAATQYAVMHLSLARMTPNTARMSEAARAAHTMQRTMMLYLFPAAMAAAAYFPAGAIGLYLLIMNLISLGQELLIRRKPL